MLRKCVYRACVWRGWVSREAENARCDGLDPTLDLALDVPPLLCVFQEGRAKTSPSASVRPQQFPSMDGSPAAKRLQAKQTFNGGICCPNMHSLQWCKIGKKHAGLTCDGAACGNKAVVGALWWWCPYGGAACDFDLCSECAQALMIPTTGTRTWAKPNLAPAEVEGAVEEAVVPAEEAPGGVEATEAAPAPAVARSLDFANSDVELVVNSLVQLQQGAAPPPELPPASPPPQRQFPPGFRSKRVWDAVSSAQS